MSTYTISLWETCACQSMYTVYSCAAKNWYSGYMCHKTGHWSWVFLVRRLLFTGFVQRLEFLKKSWSLPSKFPELEKVCKIEVKSWKNGEKSWFFFKLHQVLLKWNFFCVCEILFNLAYMSWKKGCSCGGFFLVLYWSLILEPWVWKK